MYIVKQISLLEVQVPFSFIVSMSAWKFFLNEEIDASLVDLSVPARLPSWCKSACLVISYCTAQHSDSLRSCSVMFLRVNMRGDGQLCSGDGPAVMDQQ